VVAATASDRPPMQYIATFTVPMGEYFRDTACTPSIYDDLSQQDSRSARGRWCCAPAGPRKDYLATCLYGIRRCSSRAAKLKKATQAVRDRPPHPPPIFNHRAAVIETQATRLSGLHPDQRLFRTDGQIFTKKTCSSRAFRLR